MLANVGLFVIVGLMALVLLMLLYTVANLFRKVGPNQALVVYGFRGTRIITGSSDGSMHPIISIWGK